LIFNSFFPPEFSWKKKRSTDYPTADSVESHPHAFTNKDIARLRVDGGMKNQVTKAQLSFRVSVAVFSLGSFTAPDTIVFAPP